MKPICRKFFVKSRQQILGVRKGQQPPWIVSDELWERIEPLLPVVSHDPAHPGRPRLDDRKDLCGILFVLYTGIQWESLSKELGFRSGMTAWRRLRDWNQAGVWQRLHESLLAELNAAGALDWSRAVIDGFHVPSHERRPKTGPSPVDRTRTGSKLWHHATPKCRNVATPTRQAGIVVDVTVTKQAADLDSTLRRFLAACLPHRECVIDSWSQTLNTPQPAELPIATSSDILGIGLELRIGLDLADTPAPWTWLSYLPPDRCLALINAAGFHHALVGQLPPSGTTDPVLLHWTRIDQPQTLDAPEQWQALASCLDLASIADLIHKRADDQTVDERRSWFLRITDDDHHTIDEAHTQSLGHAWNAYLGEGRSALTALGRPVVVAPEFAGGFGRGDLVLGHTLVDIKTGTAPQEKLEEWLAQLLGYVLLDHENNLKLDTIAVYSGWHPTLLTYPIAELLDNAGTGPTPTLAALRDDFHAAIQPEIDGFTAWRRRQRPQTRQQATR